MSEHPSVVLMTSDQRRHAYVARQLAKDLNLIGIVSESKAPTVSGKKELTSQDERVVRKHLAERDDVERVLLGEDTMFPDVERLNVLRGNCNSAATFEWVRQRGPQFIILYGTSIIKPPLLDHYDGRIINMHLGLSPYYRGSGTNFWPLVNREPECVGATIHLAVAQVDAGAILHQVRPEAKYTDRAHELGTKTIAAGIKAMPSVVTAYAAGNLIPRSQDTSIGHVYRRRNFNAHAVRVMWQAFDEGMMQDYVADARRRRLAYPIVEQVRP